MYPPTPSSRAFNALLADNIQLLSSCSPKELRPFLPCLARIAFSAPVVTTSTQWEKKRKVIHARIADMQEVNDLKQYLAVNFLELKQDAQKEQQLLRKLGPGEEKVQSVLASSMQYGMAIEFERSDHVRRFRLVLSETLRILNLVDTPFKLYQSDLFESGIHLDEVCDVLCLAVTELPSLLPVLQLSEALLRIEKGPQIIARVIANMPDHFDQVVTALVLNGESIDEVSLAGRCRTSAVRSLCHMHPTRSALVQSLAVTHCKHPTLALTLALEAEDKKRSSKSGLESACSAQAGVVTLLHDIIISGDEQTRQWFTQYLKCMQQKFRRHKSSAVTRLRSFLMKKLRSFTKPSHPAPTDHGEGGMESGSSGQKEERGMGNVSMEEPMEAAELVIDSNGQINGKTDQQEEDGGDPQPTTEEDEKGREDAMEVETLTSETLEELVDIMEIEIDDQESGGGGSVGAKPSTEGGEKMVQEDKEVSIKTSSEPEAASTSEMSRSTTATSKRRRHSLTLDKIDFPLISIDNQLSDDEVIDLMSLLHVCCALKTQTHMYLLEEEAASILSLIACTCPSFSPAGVRFIEVTLCVLLACPFLISLEACEAAVVRWFQWLLEKLPDFEKACGGQCSYGELLLLIAIHLKNKQLDQIEELISSTLDMKVSSSLRSGHFSLLTKLFLRVFTEDVVCAHALSVPPTPKLSSQLTGYLPVHCVHQLIKTGTFRKHGISIKNWIYQQLLTVSAPLHPTLPPLLQEFVNSVLLSSINSSRGGYHARATSNHTPFSAEEVLAVFRSDPDSPEPAYPIPSQLLMLYYILLYQDCYLSNLRALLLHQGGSTAKAYSASVLTQLPMKQLLDHAQCHQAHYSTLYPALLRLTATHFPQLCLVEDWLAGEVAIAAPCIDPVIKLSAKSVNPQSAQEILQSLQSSPSQALLLLTYLSGQSPSSLLPYCQALTSTLPLLLSPSVSRRVQDIYLSLWTKLNTVIPRRLWLETVNALTSAESRQVQPLSHDKLTEDPLTVLRCDQKVFRCPPVFELLLRVLAAYTSASKAWLNGHAHTQNCVAAATPETSSSSSAHVSKQEREELCVALIAAQESAIIQLLLEICLQTEDEIMGSVFGEQLTVLREIHCLVCSYLHQTFIAEPSLVKLIHFQGYPVELLPMMVSGVPSMHITLDFLPELVAQPHTDKQQFGFQLAAHVVQQYPLPEALSLAQDIFKRLNVLVSEIPTEQREQYFLPLLSSVVKLCQTFPPLCCEATEFLVQLSRICPLKKLDAGDSSATLNTFQEIVNTAILKI